MKKAKLQTIGYFGLFLTLGAVIASLGPTLPTLAANVGVGMAGIGILFTARSLGYLTGSVFGGVFYDRVQGHRLMIVFLIAAAGLLAFVPAIRLIALLGIILFFIGITQGGIDVGANTLLSWVHKGRVGPYLNAMYFFAGLGSFLIPLYLAQVSLDWGYRGMALVLILVVLWLSLIPSPEIPKRVSADEERLTDYTTFIAFAILAFIFIGSELSYGGWIFTYFTSSGLGAEKAAYSLTSAFWLSITLGRLLSIPIATRFEPKPIIIAYLLGAVASATLLLAFHANPLAIWIGSIGMGFSIAAIFPTTFTFVQQKVKISGRLTGIVWASGSLGAMTLPWFIGQQMETIGSAAMMAILLLGWILALGIFLIAMRAKPKAGSR